MKRDFHYHITCPVCGKGEILADGKGKVTISVQCPKCRNFYKVDLDTMKTERAQAQRRQGRR